MVVIEERRGEERRVLLVLILDFMPFFSFLCFGCLFMGSPKPVVGRVACLLFIGGEVHARFIE